jgi:hypothetical protein
MPSNETFDDMQPKRLALFAGVFIAGLIGGAVFTSTMAHSQQRTQQVRPMAQVGAVTSMQSASWVADPSVPGADAVLADRRHERPESVAPTF